MTSTEAAVTAPQVVPVAGDLVADDQWHSFAAVNHTVGDGDITFTPKSFGSPQLSIRLRNAKPNVPHDVFSFEVTWARGDLSTKTVATNVKHGTVYTVDAKAGPVTYTSFAGQLLTA